MQNSKKTAKGVVRRKRRHFKIRKRVSGTAERPRLCVSRSAKHIYAQVVDDQANRVLCATSTLSKDFKDKGFYSGNCEAAAEVGRLIGQLAKDKGIERVAFDRAGFFYHGRVKALAEAVREQGIEF